MLRQRKVVESYSKEKYRHLGKNLFETRGEAFLNHFSVLFFELFLWDFFTMVTAPVAKTPTAISLYSVCVGPGPSFI